MHFMTIHYTRNGVQANFFTFYSEAKDWLFKMRLQGYDCYLYRRNKDDLFVPYSDKEEE